MGQGTRGSPCQAQNPSWAVPDPEDGLSAPHDSSSRGTPKEALPAGISSERAVSTFKDRWPQTVIVWLASVRPELPV